MDTKGEIALKTHIRMPGPFSFSDMFYIKWIVASVALVNLFVVALVGLSLYSSLNQYEQRVSMVAQSLAHVLDRNISADIGKIDLLLVTVADEFENRLREGKIDGKRLEAFLARRQSRLEYVDGIRIADARGLVRYGLGNISAGAINISDLDYFTGPRDNPGSGLFVGRPVLSRISQRWTLTLSRRLSGPDGSFAGVVCADIAVAHFSQIFSVIDIGAHGGISLRDYTMGIIARYPAPEDEGSIIGNRTLSPELRSRFEAGDQAGTFFTPTSWDNVAKVVSYRKVGDYPLFVNVGIATEDYMADWWDGALIIMALAVLFFLLTLLSAWLIFRYILALKKTTTVLKEARGGLERKVAERTAKLGEANKALQEGHFRLITVLNSIDAGAYVADMKTYELLFINDYIKEQLGDIVGEKCWQALHLGQDGPCPFCTNDRLIGPDGTPTGVYQWDYQNTINGRWYECRDRAIPWVDGTLKRFQIFIDITERRQAEAEREKHILELKGALDKVKQLSGLLPICASCKKIRDDKGYWTQIEAYIHTHSEAEFSHGICPDCLKKLYPEYCDLGINHDEKDKSD
jgi:PAS domain-containing protein